MGDEGPGRVEIGAGPDDDAGFGYRSGEVVEALELGEVTELSERESDVPLHLGRQDAEHW